MFEGHAVWKLLWVGRWILGDHARKGTYKTRHKKTCTMYDKVAKTRREIMLFRINSCRIRTELRPTTCVRTWYKVHRNLMQL